MAAAAAAPGGVALIMPASVLPRRGAARPGEPRRRVIVRRLRRACAAAGDDQAPPPLTASNPSVKLSTADDGDIELERRRKQQELRDAERAFWQRETAMWQRQRELLMLELMELKNAVQQLEQRMVEQGGGGLSLLETANETSHLDNLSREELMERAMQGIYGVSNQSFGLKDEPYSNGVYQTPSSAVDLPVEAEHTVQQQQAAVEVSEPEQDLQTLPEPELDQEQEQEPETQISQAPAQAVVEDVIPTPAAESSSASAVSEDFNPSSPPRVDNSAWERRRKLEMQMKAMFGDLRGLLPEDLPLDLPAPSASASQSYPPASTQEDTGEGFPLTYAADPSAQVVQDDEAEAETTAGALDSSVQVGNEQSEGEEDYTKTTAWQRRRRLQTQMEDAMRQLAGDPEAAARAADPESSQPEQPDIYAGSTRPFTSHQPPTDYPQQVTAKLTARSSEDATPISASTSGLSSPVAQETAAAEQLFKDTSETGPIDAIAAAAAALLQPKGPAEAPVSASVEEVSKPAPSFSMPQAKAPAQTPASVAAEEVGKPASSSLLQAKAPAQAPASMLAEEASKPAPSSLQAKAPPQAPASMSAEEASKPAPSQTASEGDDPAVVVTRWGTFRSPVVPAGPESKVDSAAQQPSAPTQQPSEEVKAKDTVKQPASRWGSWTSHAQ